jgi:hypothetical protein
MMSQAPSRSQSADATRHRRGGLRILSGEVDLCGSRAAGITGVSGTVTGERSQAIWSRGQCSLAIRRRAADGLVMVDQSGPLQELGPVLSALRFHWACGFCLTWRPFLSSVHWPRRPISMSHRQADGLANGETNDCRA